MAERELRIPGKKKRRRPEPDVDPEFQIAPMIDILLVLLVFFMSISSTEVLQSNQDVKLPVARDAKESKKNPGQVIVNVLYNPLSTETVIEVDERSVSLGQLAPMLETKVVANPLVRVLVRADTVERVNQLARLMDEDQPLGRALAPGGGGPGAKARRRGRPVDRAVGCWTG